MHICIHPWQKYGDIQTMNLQETLQKHGHLSLFCRLSRRFSNLVRTTVRWWSGGWNQGFVQSSRVLARQTQKMFHWPLLVHGGIVKLKLERAFPKQWPKSWMHIVIVCYSIKISLEPKLCNCLEVTVVTSCNYRMTHQISINSTIRLDYVISSFKVT